MDRRRGQPALLEEIALEIAFESAGMPSARILAHPARTIGRQDLTESSAAN